jgi:hypothetical protein
MLSSLSISDRLVYVFQLDAGVTLFIGDTSQYELDVRSVFMAKHAAVF